MTVHWFWPTVHIRRMYGLNRIDAMNDLYISNKHAKYWRFKPISGKLCFLTFPRPNVYPVSAPLPNLKASAERTKSHLFDACLRSRNGGVGAEICLRKVKWLFGWQGGEFFTGATDRNSTEHFLCYSFHIGCICVVQQLFIVLLDWVMRAQHFNSCRMTWFGLALSDSLCMVYMEIWRT